MTPQERLLEHVDDARWVRWHRTSGRVFVWRETDADVAVIDAATGERLGTYLLEQPTLESAVSRVAERVNAGY